MKLTPAAACLVAVASSADASKTTSVGGRTLEVGKTFVADMGDYGSFTMTLYGDNTMDYALDLNNADDLFTEGSARNYHLHSGFLGEGASVDLSGGTAPACGPDATLGHYDPFEACGGASTTKADPPEGTSCEPPSDYCTNKDDSVLEEGAGSGACEVGDLSGRFGAFPDGNSFTVTKTGVACPGCLQDYLDGTEANYTTWASFVIHDTSPRVLCANLKEREVPPAPTPPNTSYLIPPLASISVISSLFLLVASW